MKKRIGKLLAALCGLTLMVGQAAWADVASLRGTASVDADTQAQTLKKFKTDDQLMQRDFVQQPPLIPHRIDGYIINLRANKCLTCHSWQNYKEKRATKISLTHFRDREGNELSNVAGTRYFCTQCHVPQVNAPPLVDNTFKPLDALN